MFARSGVFYEAASPALRLLPNAIDRYLSAPPKHGPRASFVEGHPDNVPITMAVWSNWGIVYRACVDGSSC